MRSGIRFALVAGSSSMLIWGAHQGIDLTTLEWSVALWLVITVCCSISWWLDKQCNKVHPDEYLEEEQNDGS